MGWYASQTTGERGWTIRDEVSNIVVCREVPQEYMERIVEANSIKSQLAKAKERIAWLEAEAKIMIAKLDTLICVHCGKVFRVEGIEDDQCKKILAKHFNVCDEHPVKALQARINAVKKWLAFNLDDHTANIIIKILNPTPGKEGE